MLSGGYPSRTYDKFYMTKETRPRTRRCKRSLMHRPQPLYRTPARGPIRIFLGLFVFLANRAQGQLLDTPCLTFSIADKASTFTRHA
jgi:hypothetical protein